MLIMTTKYDKFCNHHANVPAVSKCEACSKPLCGDCILEVVGSHFCGERCAGDSIDKRERSTASTILNSANQESRASALMAKVAILLVLIGLACAGYVRWHNNQDKMNTLNQEVHKTIQNGNEEAKMETAKDSVAR